MPAVASGWTNGPITTRTISNDVDGRSSIWTDMVFGGLVPLLQTGAAGHRLGLCAPGDFITQFLEHFRSSSDQAIGATDELYRLDLLLKIGLVAGHLLGELDELTGNQDAKTGYHNERHCNGGNHRWYSRHVQTLEPGHDRRQHEAEEYCHGQRHEDITAEVESSDHNANRDG